MTGYEIDREQPLNLDASSSQELKRVVLGSQAHEDPSASHIIPDVLSNAGRPKTARRELLSQPFPDTIR